MALDKSRYGWEGVSNGGEIYGNQTNSQTSSQSELRQEYKEIIEKLALQKIESTVLFEARLELYKRRLSSLGLEVSKEKMMRDVEVELLLKSDDRKLDDSGYMFSTNSSLRKLVDQMWDDGIKKTEEKPTQNSGSISGETKIQIDDDYQQYQEVRDEYKKEIDEQLEAYSVEELEQMIARNSSPIQDIISGGIRK